MASCSVNLKYSWSHSANQGTLLSIFRVSDIINTRMGLQIYSYVLNPANLLNDNPFVKWGMVFLWITFTELMQGVKEWENWQKKWKLSMSKNGWLLNHGSRLISTFNVLSLLWFSCSTSLECFLLMVSEFSTWFPKAYEHPLKYVMDPATAVELLWVAGRVNSDFIFS